jgi:hypothetical protein
MMDILDAVIEKTANLNALAKLVKNPDILKECIKLQEQLLDIQTAYNDLRSENTALRGKVKNLEAVIAGELVFKISAYYRKGSDEAFCPKCLDSDHKLSHLIPTAGTVLNTTHRCPDCNNRYKLH